MHCLPINLELLAQEKSHAVSTCRKGCSVYVSTIGLLLGLYIMLTLLDQAVIASVLPGKPVFIITCPFPA